MERKVTIGMFILLIVIIILGVLYRILGYNPQWSTHFTIKESIGISTTLALYIIGIIIFIKNK